MCFVIICSLALHGIDFDIPIGEIDGGVPYVTVDEEFISQFPRKTIQELHSTAEVICILEFVDIC